MGVKKKIHVEKQGVQNFVIFSGPGEGIRMV